MGTDWMSQFVPFHTSANGDCTLLEVDESPTATHAVAEAHDTPLRTLKVIPAGSGVDWMLHALPSQASASVSVVPGALTYEPTLSQTSVAPQDTAPRDPFPWEGFGVDCCVQAGADRVPAAGVDGITASTARQAAPDASAAGRPWMHPLLLG
jgi:hypothetical protein